MSADGTTPPPAPRAVYHALLEVLDLYHLSNLPQILDLFAHIQILSSQVHRQARRALKINASLVARLQAKGIAERAFVRYGALSRAHGRRLRELATDEYEGGIRREDDMMELSFQLRLIHIVTLLAKPKVALEDIANVVRMYFPALPGPDDHDDLNDWRKELRSLPGSRCYVRAMSSDQARRFALYRQRAEGLLDRTKQEGRRFKRYELLKDLSDDQEELCTEEMRSLAKEVIEEVEELVRMFEPAASEIEDVHEEHVDVAHHFDQDLGLQEPNTVYEQDVGQLVDVDTGYAEQDEEQMSDEAEAYHPLPPIRAPRSSMAPARSAPRTSSAFKSRSDNMPVMSLPSPSTGRKGRPSGLPPLTGPDYTKPRTSSATTAQTLLKPFSRSKLQNRGAGAGPTKRSRVSLGAPATAYDIDERDAKRRRAHSDE